MGELDKARRTSSSPTEMKRLQKFMAIARRDCEKVHEYIARFRVALREIRDDKVSGGFFSQKIVEETANDPDRQGFQKELDKKSEKVAC